MKTKSFIAGMLLVAPLLVRAATNDLTSALQKGLFEEEANHNLDAAAQAYQAVSAQFDKDRKLAATAIFRLGEVYRKQGQTNEATAQYERIVREFSDQQTLVTLSRQNLAGIGARSESPVSPLTRTARLEQKKLLDEEIKLVEQDLADLRKRLANGVVPQSEVRAKEREVLKLRQQVAALSVDETDLAADTSGVPVTDDEEKEIRRIQEMIKNSPDLINGPTAAGGFTPLGSAAHAGQLRVARFLLDAGATVDLSAQGLAPIHHAAASGHKAMVELLLAKGADVNARDSKGRTPLHAAAENGFQSVVEALLARKADVNAQSKNQETPLNLAAARGHGAMVELLLAKGAQTDARLANGWTALTWAASQGHSDVVKRLLAAKADPNVQDRSGRSVLSYAAERGHLDVAKLLLDAKADPNAGQKDLTLVMAARYKQLEIANLLLGAGAKPDLAGKTSQYVFAPGQSEQSMGNGPFGPFTPLQAAVSKGDAAMVKLLLKFKADANAKDPWSSPAKPLIFYALANLEMFNAFLDAGANPDATDNTKPLIVAAADVDASRVEPLIAHGANVNVRGSVQNWKEVTPLCVAAIRNDPKSVELFLNAKADVNAATPNGWTALHSAANNGSEEIVEMLLAHGADVNAKNQSGDTPLHWAVNIGAGGIGSAKMVELLLSKGADPNIRGFNNWTPLDRAKGAVYAAGSVPSPEIAAILREHGALDDLPDFNSLRVTRVGFTQPIVVFVKDTNSVNRFTLLEVVRNFYYNSGYAPNDRGVPFPDFSKVIIHRPVPGKPGAKKEIAVNLLTITNSFDCAKDTWLEFGDEVEIPEREHTLAEQPIGLTIPQSHELGQCLEGKVTFVVRGQKAEFKLTGLSNTGSLPSALDGVRNLLRSSSDLSHIKIKRTDPTTGKASEFITDSKSPGPNNVWLRAGDVIEVPDKP